MATVSNLFVDQGSYFSRFITLVTPAGTTFDLTGYTVSSQMRKNTTSSIGYTIPCSITDASAGKVKLRLNAETTENIPAGRYLYDIEITDNTGEKLRVVEGIITIVPQITRA
jgi:hypothetical protein